MSQKIYKVPEDFAALAHLKHADYQRLYQESVRDPHSFWARIGRRIDWIQPLLEGQGHELRRAGLPHPLVLRRQAQRRGELSRPSPRPSAATRPRSSGKATIRELSERITYRELYERVCQCANALKSLGVRKGDRVTIYLPMIPEAAVAMLACARIGAVHSVVFGGFSPDSLAGRIADCGSTRRDHRRRRPARRQAHSAQGQRRPALAAPGTECVKHVLVVRRTRLAGADVGRPRSLVRGRASPASRRNARRKSMDAEDPLFILYTSGSTGKPKGVLHTTGGYLVYASMTHELVFDLREDDVYWCTADVGWVTGHSYVVYGPLANGATTLMFEGVPNYPDAGRFWQTRRQAQGHDLLHRADRDPRADARRRRAGEGAGRAARCGCSARSASRSIRKRGSGITASSATAAARSSTRGGRRRPAAS